MPQACRQKHVRPDSAFHMTRTLPPHDRGSRRRTHADERRIPARYPDSPLFFTVENSEPLCSFNSARPSCPRVDPVRYVRQGTVPASLPDIRRADTGAI